MKPETRSDQSRSEYDRVTRQSLIEKHGPWIFDALAIMQELGGMGKIYDETERRYKDRHIRVENFCAKNGVCYAIRVQCVRLPQAGWNFLAKWLTPEQFAKAEEMQNLSGLEFAERTEALVSSAAKSHKGYSTMAELQSLLVETTKNKIAMHRNEEILA